MKKAPLIILIACVVGLIGFGAVTIAQWDKTPPPVDEGHIGEVSADGILIDRNDSWLLSGSDGKLFPYTQENISLPDRTLLKVVFRNFYESDKIDRYEILTTIDYEHERTESDYITLYYWNRSGAPDRTIKDDTIGTYWTAITTTAAAIQADNVSANNEVNVLYVAFESESFDDMGKYYQITLNAIEKA